MPTKNLPDFVRLAMGIKEFFLDMRDDGEMCALLLVEQEGRINYLICTSDVHPQDAFPALRSIHVMLPYSALILVHEIRMKAAFTKDLTFAEAQAEHVKNYKEGDFQRLVEEGKAADHGIIDALMILRATPDRRQFAHIMPFIYFGPGMGFSWVPSLATDFGYSDNEEMAGGIPDAVREAMSAEPMKDALSNMIADLKEDPAKFQGMAKDRMRQIQTSVCLRYIQERPGYSVFSAHEAMGGLLPK